MCLGPVAIPSVSQAQEWKESVVAFHLSRRKPLLSESALHPGGLFMSLLCCFPIPSSRFLPPCMAGALTDTGKSRTGERSLAPLGRPRCLGVRVKGGTEDDDRELAAEFSRRL